MIFRKYEGFVVNENDTKDQVLADAKLAVEVVQAQETNDIGWYINVIHPKRSYCSVVISDKIRSQYPTLAKNIDVYDEDEFLHDLQIINSRVDGVHVAITDISSQQSVINNDLTNLNTLVTTTSTAVVNLDKKVKALASSGGGSSSGGVSGGQSIDFKMFFVGGF